MMNEKNYCLINEGSHYFGYFNDKEVLKNSASGGMFTAFSNKIINLGGCVFGATFDSKNCKIRHIGVNTKDELALLRKSKYVWSEYKSCIPDIEKAIKEERYILFTGTPCQAAAIRKLFGSYEKLYIVDLFCHGTIEPRFFDDYINYLKKPVTAIDFRVKSNDALNNYCLKIWNNDDLIVDERWENNLFMQMYVNSAIIRETCFLCKFSEYRHQSDITIGDFKPSLEDKDIITDYPSIIAVNTKKGAKLLNDLLDSIKIKEITDEESINSYYKKHKDIKGVWGYNEGIKSKFINDYKEDGFLKAMINSAYDYEIKLLNKIEEKYDKNKKIMLYGSGFVGKRLLYIIRNLQKDWDIECFLSTKLIDGKAEKVEGVPIFSIDDVIDNLQDRIIVVAVSDEYRNDIIYELEKRGISDYIN